MGTARACAVAESLGGELYATSINLACWQPHPWTLPTWHFPQVCGGETGTSNIHDFMALDTAERFSPLESWLTNMYNAKNITDTVTMRISPMSLTTLFQISEYPRPVAGRSCLQCQSRVVEMQMVIRTL